MNNVNRAEEQKSAETIWKDFSAACGSLYFFIGGVIYIEKAWKI